MQKNIFSRSCAELRKPRTLTVIALFLAMNIALDLLGFRIYLTPTVRISTGFLWISSIGALFGPVPAMLMGCAADVLGFLMADTSGMMYFPGYMISKVLMGGLYGLWLYPCKTKWWRVLGASACVSVICNICLNTLWSSILYGDAIMVLLPARILKNAILLPFEVLMVFGVANIVVRCYQRIFAQGA